MKFLHQHPIEFKYYGRKRIIVSDFYLHKARLIVELDGQSRAMKKKQDELRCLVCNTLGIKILRFKESEVLLNIQSVITEYNTNPPLFTREGPGVSFTDRISYPFSEPVPRSLDKLGDLPR